MGNYEIKYPLDFRFFITISLTSNFPFDISLRQKGLSNEGKSVVQLKLIRGSRPYTSKKGGDN